MNYLVVAAHPDDETLGAGATIYKLIKQGHNVAVAIMSTHAAARANISETLAEDQSNAMKILGVENVYEADFPNIKMNIIPHLELVQFVEKCIEDFNAEVIITHHPSDTNIDHKAINYPNELYRRTRFKLQKKLLKRCGTDVSFGKNVEITWNNCSIGDDVYVGDNAIFLCANAQLCIGDHVMFGPNCSVITGDHRIDIVGKYMSKVTVAEKLPENDLPVTIEGDNWIGANAIILKGVTVGKGSVVAAGSVVIHDVPPYSIVGGCQLK